MSDFSNKVVIVTGGAQGIGRAISYAFADAGAKVVIGDVDDEAGSEAVGRIKNSGGEAIYIQCDVGVDTDVAHLMQTAGVTYGSIDILVNNAGIGHTESMFTIDMQNFDRVLSVNLRGTFLCSKYAAMEMRKKKKGVIINISSTRALMSEANTEAYAASKGGILALTHAMAVSLGHEGIRVNAISPGWIETGEWKKANARYVPQHSFIDREQHPVGRVGEPNDIAKAVLYLTTDDAGFITGQNLVIDGGMTIKMIYEE